MRRQPGCFTARFASICAALRANSGLPCPPSPQMLSTGRYSLADVHCHVCRVPLGWKYLWAQQVGEHALQQPRQQRDTASTARCGGCISSHEAVPAAGCRHTEGSPAVGAAPAPRPTARLAPAAAPQEDQQYKVGSVLLQHSLLRRVTNLQAVTARAEYARPPPAHQEQTAQ